MQKFTEEIDEVWNQSISFFLRADDGEALARYVADWGMKQKDAPLICTRIILALLANGNIRQANNFNDTIKEYKDIATQQFRKHPLCTFSDLLLLTCERKAEKLFHILKKRYLPSLKRDPNFAVMLTRIGALYFNLNASGGMLMQNMMRILGTGG